VRGSWIELVAQQALGAALFDEDDGGRDVDAVVVGRVASMFSLRPFVAIVRRCGAAQGRRRERSE
jgi:hypothetical protein